MPTVSRALNDAPDIRQDTKKLVRKIADEIGYVPNRAGVRLRTGRTNVISLVMSTDHNNHTGRLIASVAGGLRGTPYHLIVTPFFLDEDPLKSVRYIVETGSADAIILNQIMPKDPRVAYLMERNFPFATHGRTDWSSQHAYYDFDNEAYGQVAADTLFARGRKTIAHIGPPLEHSYAQHMHAGVTKATRRNGQELLVIDTITSDEPSQETLPHMVAFLEKYPHVDGIVSGSTSAATAAVAAIEMLGRTLGKDMDIYTKEASPFLTLLRPELLASPEAVGDAGAFLAKAAIHAIRNPEAAPLQELEVPTGN